MMNSHVLIVGAGASGLAAAVSAALSGASVCLVEASPKIGRSIMASGNGRCNFSNALLEAGYYNDPAFVSSVMGQNPEAEICSFFENMGLWYTTDEQGRMYPRSRAAASVLDTFLATLSALPVEIHTGDEILSVAKSDAGWEARCTNGVVYCGEHLIWAAGGMSSHIPAESLKLPAEPVQAILCPLATSPRPSRLLDGVRISCLVEVHSASQTVFCEEGEVLFRPYGVSGIVIFNASRNAVPGDLLHLDLMPDVSLEDLTNLLQRRASSLDRLHGSERDMLHFLDGALHPKLARCLMEQMQGHQKGRLSSYSSLNLPALAQLLKDYTFDIVGTADETHAQVHRGGLSSLAFDPKTLESRQHSGFYACGEALDIDGPCGGYNLSWAWISGMIAGVASAKNLSE